MTKSGMGDGMKPKKLPFDRALFAQPGAEYAPAPLWAWNGEMTPERIRHDLRMLAENGLGGAFVHARPGLVNAYLSPEWFSLWEVALKEAKRLGIKLHIYDENTYPTGYAGGHVMAQAPDCSARCIRVHLAENAQALAALLDAPELPEDSARPVKLYRAKKTARRLRLAEDLSDTPRAAWQSMAGPFVALLLQPAYTSAWYGGFANVDILRPEVTRLLLDTTYERYYERFGAEFGRTILAAFSDEPAISPGNVALNDPMVFPYSRYLGMAFYQRCGYSLEDNMAALALDIAATPGGVPAEKLRFDYYHTLHTLWRENFIQPIGAWCQAHGIAWTGHFFDENWPYPWGIASPSVMAMYEEMQWPGIDILMSGLLKETGETQLLLSVKELASAGAQLGKQRLLCECHGAGGWDASVRDFKRMGDWMLAEGITFLNPHMTYSSLAGARKHDCPQSFDERQPWWSEYGELAVYQARLCAALAQGTGDARVLVLHPTTSWYLQTPARQAGRLTQGYEEIPGDDPVKTYVTLLQRLSRAQIPFDLGDEFIMARHAKVERDGGFRVGRCRYDTLILPGEMRNLCASTLKLLRAAAKAGVRILAEAGAPQPAYVEGDKTRVRLAGVQMVPSLVDHLAEAGYAVLRAEGAGRVYHRRRLLKDGELVFVCNSGPGSARFSLPNPHAHALRLLPHSGAAEPLRAGALQGCELQPCESALFFLTDNPDAHPLQVNTAPAVIRVGAARQVPLELRQVMPQSPNTLALDYCDLELRGQTHRQLSTQAAMDRVYQAHGFDANPWSLAVQYENRVMERYTYGAGTGFGVTYAFAVQALPEKLVLAAERAGLYQLAVNGVPCGWLPRQAWPEVDLGLADITRLVRKGENTVTLTTAPFHVLAEVQPVYLQGSFALRAEDGAFAIAAPVPLGLGSLPAQGWPFYGGRAHYRFVAECAGPPKSAFMRWGRYEATALSLLVNGRYAGQAGLGDDGQTNLAPFLRAGENDLEVQLSCALKNLLGPHHASPPLRNTAWPGAWRQAPAVGRPAPADYDVIDYGLYEMPELLIEV